MKNTDDDDNDMPPGEAAPENPSPNDGLPAKRQTFRRLAVRRVEAARTAIRMIGHLANRRNYMTTEEEVRLILQVLRADLDRLEAKFSACGDTDEDSIKFA